MKFILHIKWNVGAFRMFHWCWTHHEKIASHKVWAKDENGIVTLRGKVNEACVCEDSDKCDFWFVFLTLSFWSASNVYITCRHRTMLLNLIRTDHNDQRFFYFVFTLLRLTRQFFVRFFLCHLCDESIRFSLDDFSIFFFFAFFHSLLSFHFGFSVVSLCRRQNVRQRQLCRMPSTNIFHWNELCSIWKLKTLATSEQI